MGAHGLSSASVVIDLGVAEWRLELESGDVSVAEVFPGGILIGALDGVGHGPAAADAVHIATELLRADPSAPPEGLLSACHEALRGTRGAVGSLASLRDGGAMSWAGVGNVHAVVVRGGAIHRIQTLATPGGVLGYRLPKVRAAELRLEVGDALVFATDGVSPDSVPVLDTDADAELSARLILEKGASHRDDALVLVARYRGARA